MRIKFFSPSGIAKEACAVGLLIAPVAPVIVAVARVITLVARVIGAVERSIGGAAPSPFLRTRSIVGGPRSIAGAAPLIAAVTAVSGEATWLPDKQLTCR
jgi:hypothetical protein